nr:Chain B, WD and tetratricopeptide repeats protein 1 [Homo sapiens]
NITRDLIRRQIKE